MAQLNNFHQNPTQNTAAKNKHTQDMHTQDMHTQDSYTELAQARSKAILRLFYIALCGVFGYLFVSGPNSGVSPAQHVLITCMCAGVAAAWPVLFSSSSQTRTTYIILDGRAWVLVWVGRLMACLWVGSFLLPYVVYKCIRTLTIN